MRAFSRALICLLILAVLFSFGYAALESVHDCHGEENCPICKVIALFRVFFGVACLPFLFRTILRRTEERSPLEQDGEDRATPIELKVKLLN